MKRLTILAADLLAAIIVAALYTFVLTRGRILP